MPATGQIRIERGLALNLQDGTRLVSDVYHPGDGSPAPALLMRQPYGREIASTVVYAQPEYFARAGFLVVIQDVRGRGDSSGEFYAFRNEAADGVASIEWVANLPACDGRVCMYGFSYQAYTQFAVLGNKPEALVAIAPHMSAADLYAGWFYKNGILRQATTLGWANQMLREDYRRKGETARAEALEQSWPSSGTLARALPVVAAEPVCSVEAPPNYADHWLAHETDDDYWQSLDTTEALAEADLPVFHLAGTYDFYLDGSVQAYACRQHKERDLFLLAPWKHIPWERWICGYDLGPEARIDTDALLVDWLKAQLGMAPADPDLSGARYFTLGLNRWTRSEIWPPAPDRWLTLFPTHTGQANSLFGGGQLAEEVDYSPPATYVCDPEVPVLAPGGFTPAWGPVDLRPQQQGNNLLVFTSPPFSEPTTISGHPELTLVLSSDVPESDLVARLSWVRADESALFLTLAATTVQFTPGEATTAHLQFEACSFHLQAGESLRLDICGHAYPLLARNTNTGGSALRAASPAEFRRARVSLHQSESHTSALRLPIVPLV